MRKIDVAVLSCKRVGYEKQATLVRRIVDPGRNHKYCPVRATGNSLPCERYLLAPLIGTKEESKEQMVVVPGPTYGPPSSEQYNLTFYTNCVML